MADDDSSDLSSLDSLSPAPSEDSDLELRKDKKGILKFFHKVPKGKAAAKGSKKEAKAPVREETPPRRERAPSPPHEYVLADNQDIAFIVMFRNRLSDAFPKNLANFGPQELERDIVDGVPGDRVEHFLCALLKLLLNRQQDVKPGHYHRALEEAVLSHKAQWVAGWEDSPLAEGKTFATMTPTERLTLLRALILWAMSSSKAVRDIIDRAYKGKRKDDDSNIVLSIQPWGSDSDKRRYYLVEGRDDTAFRVYRESNPAGFINRTWWSVAGSIDEIRVLIEKLETVDGGPKAKRLAKRLNDEIPRFEATEEKRRRREYRQFRKDQFKRPEPGFSVYEGRTRGKRIKYTYSDDEDFLTDSTGTRRSTRHSTRTPAEPAGPTTTASGRQVRPPSRLNGTADTSISSAAVGEGAQDADVEMEEPSFGPTGRPRRSAAVNHGRNGWANKESRRAEEYEEYDSQAEEEDEDSEPELGDDEEDDHVPEDEEEEDDEEFEDDKDAMLDDEDEELGRNSEAQSVMVKLPVHAVLDRETGKWGKAEEPEAAAAEDGESAPAAPGRKLVRKSDMTPAESGTTTPSNGDVTMTELTQVSVQTPNSPAKTADEISLAVPTTLAAAAGETVAANGVLETVNGTADKGTGETAEKTGHAATPGKENSVPAADGPNMASPLTFRSSPEKTHHSRPETAVANS